MSPAVRKSSCRSLTKSTHFRPWVELLEDRLAPARLYGATGGDTAANLLLLNPATGGTTVVGAIGFAVTGLAFHPTTGELFGSTSSLSPTSPRSIIRINPATGAGTLVGSTGLTSAAVADITFDPTSGVLYGWSEQTDDLVTINTTTGAATVIGNSGISTRGSGISANAAGTLFFAGSNANGALRTIDKATGQGTTVATLTGGPLPTQPISALSFEPQTDVLYGVNQSAAATAPNPAFLVTIDTVTGVVTSRGQSIDDLDAIAWSPATEPLSVGGTPDGRATVFAPDAAGQFGTAPAATLAPFGAVSANVRTATADVNGDTIPDTVLVTGPGTPIRVAVVSGRDNATVLVTPFDPFGGDFLGGGFVTAGDFDRDGRAEFVVTPDQGGGPRISIFSLGAGGAAALRANFLTIEESFRGGARPGAGDINADGVPDLVVSAGFLGGPRIVVLNGLRVFSVADFTSDADKLVSDFFAFSPELRNGAYVDVGDVNGDGFGDLVFGAGPGGGPEIRIASGQTLLTAGSTAALSGAIADFFLAGDLNNRGGVRVAVKDADGDGRADVVAGTGGGQASFARVYLGKDFTSVAEPAVFQDLNPFASAVLADGVYVG